MMRLKIGTDLRYAMAEPVDVLLAIEAAQQTDQIMADDLLTVDGSGPLRAVNGEDNVGRRTWLRAQGRFHARYRAVVEVDRTIPPIDCLPTRSRGELPAEVIPYIWPSRYCEADRFEAFVAREFGAHGGGAKALAMAEWIHEHVDYRLGTSDSTTTAVDAFVSRQGVCRDFAHLLASFARAAGIPARLVSAYAWKLDPADFHAVVELWLGDAWHLIDATRLAPLEGLVRIGVGRDATDIAFMTIFGSAEMVAQSVSVARLD